MKAGFLTFGCDSGRSGIGRYAIELLREFAEFSGRVDFEVVGFDSEKSVFLGDVDLPWLGIPDFFKTPLRNLCWHQLNFYRMARARGWDAVFLPAGNRRLPLFSPCPTIGVVHDFSALHVANKYDRWRMFYIRHVLPFLMNRLDAVITISESSRRDIIDFARVPEDRITIIHHGVDHARYKVAEVAGSLDTLNKYQLKRPYILYISRIEHPGKNHVTLIEAFEKFKEKTGLPHQLVLAGSDWDRAAEVHEFAGRSKFMADIVFTGFVSGDDMAPLLTAADMFVFPSLFEGFGMPVLEAMACGIPVACSDVSSMPEVAGNAAVLFRPHDPESIVAAMTEVLCDVKRAQDLKQLGLKRASGFTWRRSAEETVQVIEKTVAGRKKR